MFLFKSFQDETVLSSVHRRPTCDKAFRRFVRSVCFFFFFTPVMTLKFGIDPLLAIKDKWLRAIDWIHSFKCSLCSVLIWGFRIDVSGGRCLKCSSICDTQQEWTEWQLLWPPQVAEGQAVLMIYGKTRRWGVIKAPRSFSLQIFNFQLGLHSSGHILFTVLLCSVFRILKESFWSIITLAFYPSVSHHARLSFPESRL